MLPVLELSKPRTRIWYAVPPVMLSIAGPGELLGTRLVVLPPELSSLANLTNVPNVEPVNTPSTVSKSLPIVSRNDVGDATLNEHGAVHVHQTLGVPLPVLMRSEGSPPSAVPPMLYPDNVSVVPDPVTGVLLTKSSFGGGG